MLPNDGSLCFFDREKWGTKQLNSVRCLIVPIKDIIDFGSRGS